MAVVQVDLAEANAYVDRFHRHSKPTLSHKFSLGCVADDEIVGVAIIGRPVARRVQDGWTLEVLRVCTTGHHNACSFLYGAAWRAIRALGYLRAVTYTKSSEEGTSVRAAGWVATVESPGRSWNVPSRPREDKHELTPRIRWEIKTASYAPGLPQRPIVEVPAVDPDQLSLEAA